MEFNDTHQSDFVVFWLEGAAEELTVYYNSCGHFCVYPINLCCWCTDGKVRTRCVVCAHGQ